MAISNSQNDTNTGDARVRDHLANERTFLAWTRTGVSMMGFGYLVAKIRIETVALHIHTESIIRSSTLGVLFALAGMITVILSTWRYFAVRNMIDTGSFRPFGYRIALFALLLVGVGVAIILNLAGYIAIP